MIKPKKYGNVYNNYSGVQLNFWEWLRRKLKWK